MGLGGFGVRLVEVVGDALEALLPTPGDQPNILDAVPEDARSWAQDVLANAEEEDRG
ncbi:MULTISPECIES: hypothetical protein [unclassified Streptomyces]|uniref:hypothetical protein n=1 Tax=unclassified Streptomyces TaxID=2593676 RepID=UPI00345105B4